MSAPEATVVIPACQARDMLAVLTLIEDWLLHTSDEVLDDLGAFAFPCDTDPQRAARVNEFIGILGGHGAMLHRLLQPLF